MSLDPQEVLPPTGEDDGFKFAIQGAADHRRLLLDAMVALVEHRINVAQANALASLSSEVHKSIKQQFDMLCYASSHFAIGPGGQIQELPAAQEEDDDEDEESAITSFEV